MDFLLMPDITGFAEDNNFINKNVSIENFVILELKRWWSPNNEVHLKVDVQPSWLDVVSRIKKHSSGS